MDVIKERIVKWSRKVENIEIILKPFCIILVILFVCIVLSNIGILPTYIYHICFKLLRIILFFGCLINITKSVLKSVKENEKNDVFCRNHLIYILLSDKNVIESILLFFVAITVLCKIGIILVITSILLYLFAPDKIAEYFDEKLLK